MYAFCDFLLRERSPCPVFEHWSHFDGTHCRIGSTGCQMFARVLGLPTAAVHTVDLRNQMVGTRGVRALSEAIRVNPRILHVGLYGAVIDDPGAAIFIELFRDAGEAASSLETLDLSVNKLSFPVCQVCV